MKALTVWFIFLVVDLFKLFMVFIIIFGVGCVALVLAVRRQYVNLITGHGMKFFFKWVLAIIVLLIGVFYFWVLPALGSLADFHFG